MSALSAGQVPACFVPVARCATICLILWQTSPEQCSTTYGVSAIHLKIKVELLQFSNKSSICLSIIHDDVIKWKHFPHYWPFVRGIHRSPMISAHKGQSRGVLMFSLIWVNNREAGDLRRHRAHYNVTVIFFRREETMLQTLLIL